MPPVLVEYIDPNLRKRYGQKIRQIGLKQGLVGEREGLWRIIENPLGTPVNREPETKIEAPAIPVPQTNVINFNTIPIDIIILTLNNIRYTRVCIETIRKHTQNNYSFIIVDNGSNDGTIDYLRTALSERDILIRNQRNRGFSEGNNQGLLLSDAEYVLFLNNDIKVLDNQWLNRFLEACIYSRYDIVGPTMRRLDVDNHAKQFVFIGDGSIRDEYHYLEGWCLFGKRTIFEHLSGFDERFSPAYSEDADLSFAARKMGYKLGHVPNHGVSHFGNTTSGTMGASIRAICAENNRKLYDKWIGNKKKICLIRQGAIGDVLLTTPIVRSLRKAYPVAQIDYVTKSPQMLAGNPHIDDIYQEIQKHKQYDQVTELAYEHDPSKIRIDTMAKQAGVTLDSREMEVFFPISKVSQNGTPYICVHTGRSWPNREWSLQNWYKVLNSLAKKYVIYQLGSGDTQILSGPGLVPYIGHHWADVASLIAHADFFVGIDSAPCNLAKALKKQTFTVYGCVNPYVVQADTQDIPLVAENVPCAGCRDRSTATYVTCTQQECYCLTKLTSEYVLDTIGRNTGKNL